MGDHLPAGKPPQYFTKPLRPTQPPTLSWMGNKYQPKCGDILQLGVKGRQVWFITLWLNVWVAGKTDPSLTRVIPECLEMNSYTDMLPLPSCAWQFLQRAQRSHCKRCISYSNSVRLSVRPSHADIVSKRRHVARCSLHRWIAKCV